jgi:DNA-binding transcriptional regulator YiaG
MRQGRKKPSPAVDARRRIGCLPCQPRYTNAHAQYRLRAEKRNVASGPQGIAVGNPAAEENRHPVPRADRAIAAPPAGAGGAGQAAGARRRPGGAAPAEEEDDGPSLRFSAKGLAAQRKRLGLSAASIARILGVSALSVYKWESGKTRPRARQLEAIAGLRKMGKREAMARLDG